MQYICDSANKINEGDEPIPTPTNKISDIQNWLNNNYDTNLNVDGIYGPLTEMALVKAYQRELNIQFDAGIDTDGIFGKATYNASVIVSEGCSGNITKIIQSTLICLGYPLENDSVYGPITRDNVITFQISNNLDADGITGPNTFMRLFSQFE